MKTYVVCLDGTWNSPHQKDRDPVEGIEVSTESNVLRIYRFLTNTQKNNGISTADSLEYGTILSRLARRL